MPVSFGCFASISSAISRTTAGADEGLIRMEYRRFWRYRGEEKKAVLPFSALSPGVHAASRRMRTTSFKTTFPQVAVRAMIGTVGKSCLRVDNFL